ncbi:His-Xaa-Ser system radical SAM maturase HxsB [Brevifollis gellanilyticus]|uniref:His-Xaa-Ser system radical SAM maturase HxsB n=1 Tax=Brevifollis gellanilyticus TaxID=748831 RepID=UPI0011BE32AB|nr:His-Xaa-Ser system radical SAM maturase HxsB [Brevifollis gellanilyticus]
MNGLNRSFKGPESYRNGSSYRLLPMKFMRFRDDRYLVTSMGGDYMFLSQTKLNDIVTHKLQQTDTLYPDLLASHLIADDSSTAHLDLLAAKYRTRHSRLPSWTALHMFVTTLRCDHSCQYCQVSRVSEDRESFDMTPAIADRAIGLMFQSPSACLKVEFQGGESLLNFDLVRYIVSEAKRRNDGRQLEFVITTNLANLTEEILSFSEEHGISFSTSLDGPAALHNANRPRPGRDSHAKTEEGIERLRQRLGKDAVSALMTTTAASLDQPERIIDEYVRMGFDSIFLRYISPYGFAVKSSARIGYETKKFVDFFKRGLAYIVDLNRRGIFVRETYTQIVLQKILMPGASGYIDLQSPAGMGISGIVYNYNGEVYSSDEGRMLAEMGDRTFRLGTVHDTYEKLFLDSPLLPMIHESMLEGVPGCTDCALQPYCGSDPVFHHRTQGDFIGHRPTSSFCERNMAIIKHILTLLEDDKETASILKSWL